MYFSLMLCVFRRFRFQNMKRYSTFILLFIFVQSTLHSNAYLPLTLSLLKNTLIKLRLRDILSFIFCDIVEHCT